LVIWTGLTFAVLTGCDQRETILTGLGDASDTAATTFVNAFFERLIGPAPASLGIL
jgi:hypothetical protein